MNNLPVTFEKFNFVSGCLCGLKKLKKFNF
jgi:hypothetical protein